MKINFKKRMKTKKIKLDCHDRKYFLLVIWIEHKDVAILLVENKADVNARGNDGKTPCDIANGKSKMLQRLIASCSNLYYNFLFFRTWSYSIHVEVLSTQLGNGLKRMFPNFIFLQIIRILNTKKMMTLLKL